MKRFLLSVALLGLVAITACADDDKPIPFSQLPTTAQEFVRQYFNEEKVALTKMETDFFGKSYDIIFANGDKIEFDSSGNWKEIKCRFGEVPADVIPTQIKEYINNVYPEAKVMKIEKERHKYEVKLSNGWELDFNKRFELIDLDH